MEWKKPLIVGIDPGTTTGCAVLDINGNLVYISSSKQFDLNQLISSVINFGRVVLAGTDKGKVPGLVEAFATKLGARIVSPQEDLKVHEKRKMIDGFNFDNEHQGDALASALFAFKQTKPLLDKIDYFANENKKYDISDRIKELVITKKISIKSAVSVIEKRDDESNIIENVIMNKKINEKDFLRLYDKLRKYENDLRFMRKYNNKLRNTLNKMEKMSVTQDIKKDTKEPDNYRNSRLNFFENLVKSKDDIIGELRLLTKKYESVISMINKVYILKKLDTLGINEFNLKNKIINIQKNDVLLVDNPNIVSNALIELLKDKIFVIVHRNPISKKIENNLPFIFINAKNLEIEEFPFFGFVEKSDFEIEKNKINWVSKIVNDYKKEKEQLIS